MAKKIAVKVLLCTAFFIAWATVAGAWTFSVQTYDYIGSGTLKGTVPGATYSAKMGTVTNDSGQPAQLSVDLYHGTFIGFWQWSPDNGTRWVKIPTTTTTWTQMVNGGASVSFRVMLTNADNKVFHILSASPYGAADTSIGDAYYYAFSPNSAYYTDYSIREVGPYGYVVVIKDSVL